jgi:hypothetical protein
MGEFMFSVAVDGKANAVFDTADEALRFSTGHVYLSPSAMDGAKQLLERGEPYSYAYGFTVAGITPVAKNPVSPPPSKKVIDDLKRDPVIVEPDIVVKLQDVQERFIFQGGSEFACNLADEIVELRRNNEELTATVQAAILDVARFEAGYRRYEKLRRLNARQLQELFKKSSETGVAFDDLVDALFGGEE